MMVPNVNPYVRFPTLLLLFVFQPDNEPLAAPQLNVVAVNHTLRLCYGLRVVVTDQRLKAYEVAVEANGISPVLCHLFTLRAAAHRQAAWLLSEIATGHGCRNRDTGICDRPSSTAKTAWTCGISDRREAECFWA
jgi:hypothetical protein